MVDVVEANLSRADSRFVAELIEIVTDAELPNPIKPDVPYLWWFGYEDRLSEEAEWLNFRNQVSTGSRFFNKDVVDILDSLFAPLDRLSAGGLVWEEKPVHELRQGTELWRARCANTGRELEEIVHGLPAQLHAPPPDKAPAGRMNVARQPAFYASIQPATAAAETRPHIGSDVVLGRFRTTRPLKVLDFTVLARSSGVTYSIWDEEFRRKSSLRALLLRLESRIAQPVRPGEEHEYLFTQVVADYLRNRLCFDGLMFRSVQEDKGHNVVLFYGALGSYSTGIGYPDAPLAFVRGSAALHKVNSIKFNAPPLREGIDIVQLDIRPT